MRINLWLVFIVAFTFANICNGQSKFSEIEKFLDIAVYIQDIKISTEKVDDKNYEIWLKDIKTKEMKPKTFANSGTGFFIHTDTDIYLITAAHVAKKMSTNTDIVIRSSEGTPKIFKLKDLVFDKDSLRWTEHFSADVAAIHLNNSQIPEEIVSISFPFDQVVYELRAPFREREVTVYGFPLSLGLGNKISPITKTSKPSSSLIDLPRFDNKKNAIFYLLDDPGVSGFSGAPVFELPQIIGTGSEAIFVKIYQIVGLIHGTISDNTSGFTAVVPSYYIKETIENAPGLSDTLTYNYKDGKIWSQRIYKDGDPWTVLSNFKPNGEPQEKGTLFNGSGTLNIYDEKGKLIEIREYSKGYLLDIKRFK